MYAYLVSLILSVIVTAGMALLAANYGTFFFTIFVGLTFWVIASAFLFVRAAVSRISGTKLTSDVYGLEYNSLFDNVRAKWETIEKVTFNLDYMTARIIFKNGAIVHKGKQFNQETKVDVNSWCVVNTSAADTGLSKDEFLAIFAPINERVTREY